MTYCISTFNKIEPQPSIIYYQLAGNFNLQLLNPWAFNKRINATSGGGLSVQAARTILRPILRVFQVRRVMATEVELPGNTKIRVGALMLPFSICTVELAMTRLQAGAYYKVYRECAEITEVCRCRT